MECPKCQSKHNIVKKPASGPHSQGMYCADCGRWLKWIAKPIPADAKSNYKDNTIWQPPSAGWVKPIFGRRHIR